MRKTMAVAIATALIGSAASAAPAPVHRPIAKISMSEARAIALKAAPGQVKKAEYEKEGGAWRYSFDIRQKGHIREIGVDSRTGKIIENKIESRA